VNYYIAEGTTQRGPFSEQDLVGAGLKRENLVWREGMPQWLPAHQVAELQPYLTPASAAPVPLPGIAPVGYATPQYAVYPPAGISPERRSPPGSAASSSEPSASINSSSASMAARSRMLVISVVCAVLAPFTCGITIFALPVMHVIGMIEGIIYLTKSDAEFYNIYMIQQRQWF